MLWGKKFDKFKNLFAYLNKPLHDPDRVSIGMRYFYYDIRTNRTLYLNGAEKIKIIIHMNLEFIIIFIFIHIILYIFLLIKSSIKRKTEEKNRAQQ